MYQIDFTAPIPSSALVTVIVFGIVMIAVLAILALPIYLLRITVFSDGIVVKAPPMYRFSVKREEVEEIFVADLNSRDDLKPRLRTWGTRLPGYALGWFKLGNGAKAFCVISSNTAVVFKLRNNTYLIVTPSNTTNFIQTLKMLGWSTP